VVEWLPPQAALRRALCSLAAGAIVPRGGTVILTNPRDEGETPAPGAGSTCMRAPTVR